MPDADSPRTPPIAESILDAVGHTPMVRLRRVFADFPQTVLAKVEFVSPSGSMKDRIGVRMIEVAEQAGHITPGDTLVEPTSGNTGLGLAMAAAVKGYGMIIVMPEKMSREKELMLRAYGAEVIRTPTEYAWDHPEGYIAVAKNLAAQPGHYMCNQYENAGNPDAHEFGTGPEILEQTGGAFTHFVCGMGTGGTITGCARAFQSAGCDAMVVGADPVGSIFSGGEPEPYHVEGIGYDFWPGVFDKDLVDRMYRIGDQESFTWARRLARQEGLMGGGSCGTVAAAAHRLLESGDVPDDGTVVIFLHDTGRNYLTKCYDDEWMRAQGFEIEK